MLIPPDPLPECAPADELKWQPVLDYDKDGCYNVAAIGADGRISKGLPLYYGVPAHCRDERDMDRSNVYSRKRCSHDWCVYLYDYYFEKDESAFMKGHVHDWEHIAVWVSDNKAQYVSASAHGLYNTIPASDVLFEGTHPKMVYHKDGDSTHAFRFGHIHDNMIENHKGVWFRSPLVSYHGFPEGLRAQLHAHHFGHATMGTRDANFTKDVILALPRDTQVLANFLVDDESTESDCMETCGYCDEMD
ncbi:hypothetical protein SLS53_009004 [Cytospora paraplurivora]|uniref:Uncharacterized protein n=1 Tax=Cytospora paraplurivora TaxID=2898453 RepID=A0AAN9TXL5_9PEZI